MLEGFGGSPEPEYDYGLPGESVRGLPYQLGDLFTPYRYPIEREAGVKPVSDGGEYRMDPLSGQMIYETPAEVDPGQYGEGEFGLEYTPVVRGVKSGLQFFQDMVMDPEARQRAADVMRQAPAEIIRDMKLKTNAASMGLEYIQDPKTGEVLSTAEVPFMAPAITAVGTSASLLRSGSKVMDPLSGEMVYENDNAGEAPGTVLGVMGGRRATSGPDLEAEYRRLEESGMSSEDIYLEMQRLSMIQDKPSFIEKIKNSFLGAAAVKTYFPAYRDDVEGDIRFVIDQSGRELIVKGKRDPGETGESPIEAFDREAGLPKRRPDEDYGSFNLRKDEYAQAPYTDKQVDNLTGLFEGESGFLEIGFGGNIFPPEYMRQKLGIGGNRYEKINTVLEEIVDDPTLFNQYPHLRSIQVRPVPPFNWGTLGAYSPEGKMIQMGLFKADDAGLQKFMSTLDHEMSHAIQHKEGVSGGANAASFKTPTQLRLEKTVEVETEENISSVKQFTTAVVASFYKGRGSSGRDAEADAESMVNEINDKPYKPEIPANEQEIRDVIDGVRKYITAKVDNDPKKDLEMHRNNTYEEAVDSGQMLVGTYRTRNALEKLVGPDVTDLIDRNDASIIKKLSLQKANTDQLRRAESANHQEYLANPGETNARISQLLTTGIKNKVIYRGSKISPKLAMRFEQVLPDAVEISRDNDGRFRSLTFTRDVSGQELRKVGSPNALRELVAGELPVDRSQIKDPRLLDYPFRSKEPDGGHQGKSQSRKNYLTQRLAYVRGNLEQDNMMHPVTRKKLAREYRSIMDELKSQSNDTRFTPPEQKAQGGPVGGLDVYFSKMQMQGT